MKSAQHPERLGILGGGQLARMLVEAAQGLGIDSVVLARSKDEPAAQVCPNVVLGECDDPEALKRLFDQASVLLFESEFVRTETLQAVLDSYQNAVRFVPSLGSIHEVQSKLRQKRLLDRLAIRTSPWRACELSSGATESEIEAWVSKLGDEWGGALVLKWAEQGYDGKGTWIAPPSWDLDAHAAAGAFVASALGRGIVVYGERKVAFRRELAQVACRSLDGELMAYSLAVSEQSSGVCRKVWAPASAFGVASNLESDAVEIARRISNELSLVGTFAVEFFETDSGELWVNELAPRVHNTGHLTQDACTTSQFENHIRAAVGLPLGDGRMRVAVAGMLNLLGPEGVNGVIAGSPMPDLSTLAGSKAGVWLHEYGKREYRPGRKLGHINVTCGSVTELETMLIELERIDERWADSLRRSAPLNGASRKG